MPTAYKSASDNYKTILPAWIIGSVGEKKALQFMDIPLQQYNQSGFNPHSREEKQHKHEHTPAVLWVKCFFPAQSETPGKNLFRVPHTDGRKLSDDTP